MANKLITPKQVRQNSYLLMRISARENKEQSKLTKIVSEAMQWAAKKALGFINTHFGNYENFVKEYQKVYELIHSKKKSKGQEKAAAIYLYQIKTAGLMDSVSSFIKNFAVNHPFLARYWKVIVAVVLVMIVMLIASHANAATEVSDSSKELVEQLGSRLASLTPDGFVPPSIISGMNESLSECVNGNCQETFHSINMMTNVQEGFTSVQGAGFDRVFGPNATPIKNLFNKFDVFNASSKIDDIFQNVIAPHTEKYIKYFSNAADKGNFEQITEPVAQLKAQALENFKEAIPQVMERLKSLQQASDSGAPAAASHIDPKAAELMIKQQALNQVSSLIKPFSQIAVQTGKDAASVNNELLNILGQMFQLIPKII